MANDKPLVEEYFYGNRKKAAQELFDKYEQLVFKQMGFINKSLSKASLPPMDKTDYKSEAYITMLKALDSLDMSKVKDDFGFYCRYNQYLSSQNRDLMNKILKYVTNTTPITRGYGSEEYSVLDTEQNTRYQKSVHEQYEDNEKSRIINQAIANVMKRSDPKLRVVLAGFRDGAKAAQVREDLGIASSEYTKLVKRLRSTLREEISAVQSSSNVDVFA